MTKMRTKLNVNSDYRRGVNEIFALLELYAAIFIVIYGRFGTIYLSHLQGASDIGFVTREDAVNKLFRNVGNYLQIYSA